MVIGAGLGPDRVAIGVVAVMVRVEDVFDGLWRNLLGVGHGGARAAGEVSGTIAQTFLTAML